MLNIIIIIIIIIILYKTWSNYPIEIKVSI